ncbi:unnamed protein product [Caenorhabditis angaria]|uniref:G-protein coupled receptors family 1 profile domain-containing protein n=1 Tax=Caenorhabditis angaria TaxID=860376 RepID=A0A9P1IZV9_9PELO|nr:unnamed protein product [Caenorhabditis angaria]
MTDANYTVNAELCQLYSQCANYTVNSTISYEVCEIYNECVNATINDNSTICHIYQQCTKTTLQTILSASYIIIVFIVPLAGIALNSYVLSKLIKLAQKSVVRFETTSGLPLAAMSIGDSITLFSLLSQALLHYIPKTYIPLFWLHMFCKSGLYMIYTTSAFSVWCWFVLSVLRYTAVFHPIRYRTIWRQPRNALKVIVLAICIAESYILFIVEYDDDGYCNENLHFRTGRYSKVVHISDIFLFYAIPSMLRTVLDFIVLLHCYSPFTIDSLDRIIVDRRYAISGPTKRFSQTGELESLESKNVALALSVAVTAQGNLKNRSTFPKKKTAMVMRSIGISVLNLLLNLPSLIVRSWATIDMDSFEKSGWMAIEPVCQVLYFSQFACNAFYLATSIYETSGSPRSTVISSSSNRHVSRCISEEET